MFTFEFFMIKKMNDVEKMMLRSDVKYRFSNFMNFAPANTKTKGTIIGNERPELHVVDAPDNETGVI